MELWQRLLIVVGVSGFAVVVARLVDRRLSGRDLPPEAVTRYRVLRRSLTIAIVAIGILSAALIIPEVRAVAGGILASSAVLGLVIGLAAQRPIANFVAGVVIAFTQPVRLGDTVTIDDVEGTVEEIGLTYTFIRTEDNARLVIPNEKLASDTIRNSTIVSREKLAEVTVQVPIDSDLDLVVGLLRSEMAGDPRADVLVTGVDERVAVAVRAWAADEDAAEQVESELRTRMHRRLRAGGIF